MKTYKLTSIIWREEKGYVSKCPELGVASAGDTVEEALKNLREAIELYLENAKRLRILGEVSDCSKAERNSKRNFSCNFRTSRLNQRGVLQPFQKALFLR